ncbi:MAG: hypothetical protein IKW52_01930 [Alistipes sp.]|nr:hypothetical protein [Alistipes sp.]
MYAVVVDAMVEQGRLTEEQVAEAMQKASAKEGVRFSMMDNAQAAAEVAPYLNAFNLYYRGIDERIIPFASVYLNKNESQNIANELINAWNNGENRTVREYIDRAYEVARNANVQGNILDGSNKKSSTTRGNDRLGSGISRLGRYYYSPELYSEVKRADSGSTGRGKVRYSLSDAPTFYSNAEFAVRGIKQEKATPEQWLKMIEKAGGLKAGEDKWLGLSDWLKASDKKTLSKDEVLQYIADNNFVIEEVEYGETESFYSST